MARGARRPRRRLPPNDELHLARRVDRIHDFVLSTICPYSFFAFPPSTIPTKPNSKRRTLPKAFGVQSTVFSFSVARQAVVCCLLCNEARDTRTAERRSPWTHRFTFARPGSISVAPIRLHRSDQVSLKVYCDVRLLVEVSETFVDTTMGPAPGPLPPFHWPSSSSSVAATTSFLLPPRSGIRVNNGLYAEQLGARTISPRHHPQDDASLARNQQAGRFGGAQKNSDNEEPSDDNDDGTYGSTASAMSARHRCRRLRDRSLSGPVGRLGLWRSSRTHRRADDTQEMRPAVPSAERSDTATVADSTAFLTTATQSTGSPSLETSSRGRDPYAATRK